MSVCAECTGGAIAERCFEDHERADQASWLEERGMSTEELDGSDIHRFRLTAREWLRGNMTRLDQAEDRTYLPPTQHESNEIRVAHARKLQALLYDAGYAGISYPLEYGGAGLNLDYERVFFEEATGYDMPTQVFAVSLNILGKTLLEFGSTEQKSRHLPRMLRGDEIWLQLLSEPTGGSDLAGLVTRASRDGDTYILNGQKTWSTGAGFADFAMCPARTRWDIPKHKGISLFIVDLRLPGIEIRPIKQINGQSDFCEEFLTDVVVPAQCMIGAENDGWTVVRGLLEIEHEWVGRTGGVHTPPSAVDDLVALVKRSGLEADDGARRQVAAILVLQAVQLALAVRVSQGIANGDLIPAYGGLLKLGNDELRQRRSETALTLAGSSGIAWEPGAFGQECAAIYLCARSASIAGGTAEIQRNNVSERALALPREPVVDRDRPFSEVPKN
jgi:alkylation response protein AidB-like acyl-CoA dehydrogenase